MKTKLNLLKNYNFSPLIIEFLDLYLMYWSLNCMKDEIILLISGLYQHGAEDLCSENY